MNLDPQIDITTLPDVYEPSEDSYLLLKAVEISAGESMLEIGCGTGIVALHAAKLGAVVTAADINPTAVDCTKRNAAANGLRIRTIQSDLFSNIQGNFDVIAFNPPYLPKEGKTTSWIEKSWEGGDEGSEISIRFLDCAWRHLNPGGRVYLILSSLGGLMSVVKASKEKYDVEPLAEEKMFFESVYAYRFKPRHFEF